MPQRREKINAWFIDVLLLLSPGGKSGEFEGDEGVAHPHHLQIRPSSEQS